MSSRRMPWVTFALLAINVLVHVWLAFSSHGAEVAAAQAERAVSGYRAEHPMLRACGEPPTEIPETAADPAPSRPDPEAPQLMPEAPQAGDMARLVARSLRATPEVRAEYEQLCAARDYAWATLPVHRYGFLPSAPTVRSMITYQFVHGGVLHLLMNLWFLFLVGANIEDRWGRVAFPVFYVLGGVVAALAQRAAFPHADVPMVGASGAVAATMGAFLVREARSNIRFFWWFPISRTGTFSAPAWFMLPLWLLSEVLDGVISLSFGGRGVAHWAHVGGFVFGVGAAFAVLKLGLEAKVDAKLDRQDTVLEVDPRLAGISARIDAGDAAGALLEAERLAEVRPRDLDLQLEIARAARAADQKDALARALMRLISLYLQKDMAQPALELFQEARDEGWDQRISPRLRLRIARELFNRGQHDLARREFRKLHAGGISDETAVLAVIGHAEAMHAQGHGNEARQVLQAALGHVAGHLDWQDRLGRTLKALSTTAAAAPPRAPSAPSDGTGRH